MTNKNILPQPKHEGSGKNVWEEVVNDMEARSRFGIEKYGTSLQTFNGRDALVDAYQECLDLCVYLKQRIMEDEIQRRRRGE